MQSDDLSETTTDELLRRARELATSIRAHRDQADAEQRQIKALLRALRERGMTYAAMESELDTSDATLHYWASKGR